MFILFPAKSVATIGNGTHTPPLLQTHINVIFTNRGIRHPFSLPTFITIENFLPHPSPFLNGYKKDPTTARFLERFATHT
jgi:hypothetical protein